MKKRDCTIENDCTSENKGTDQWAADLPLFFAYVKSSFSHGGGGGAHLPVSSLSPLLQHPILSAYTLDLLWVPKIQSNLC